MIKRLILLSFCVLMLVSCASVDIVTEKSPFIEKLGKEGEWVFTTNQNLTGIDAVNITRISGAYDPLTGNVYGAIEGDFSRFAFNTAMRISKETEKIKSQNLTFWREKNTGLLLYCPKKGIILFAKENMDDVYDIACGIPAETIDNETSIKMLESQISFFVNKPKVLPDVGINLSEKMLDSFENIKSFLNNNVLDAQIEFKTENNAKTCFTMLKAAFVTKAILSGEKPDYKRISETVILEGNLLFIKNFEVPEEQINSLVSTMINKDN